MDMPIWADNIIRKVVRQHRRARPFVRWRRMQHKRLSSGGYNEDDELTVSAGSMQRHAKLTLLHELAHWAVGDAEGHSPRFWRKAWQLYRQFRVPVSYVLKDEAKYKTGVLPAYWASRDPRGRRPRITHVHVTAKRKV